MQLLLERTVRRRDGSVTLLGSWAAQFRDAVSPGSEFDPSGNPAPITAQAAVLHYISITWKVIAAFVPPGHFLGGYPNFFGAIVLLAGLMYIIVDFSTLFACAVGLSNQMLGLTILAFGTNLPDALGSCSAATQAVDADPAITNITGSNAVLVFLGLGLPFVIATIYYGSQDETYVNQSGPLGFSTLLYVVCASYHELMSFAGSKLLACICEFEHLLAIDCAY